MEERKINEVTAWIKKLKSNKTAGIDELPVELLVHGSETFYIHIYSQIDTENLARREYTCRVEIGSYLPHT